MRKITKQAKAALESGEFKRIGDTRVDGDCLFLHGNHIATKTETGTLFTLAGRNTSTTRERLKAAGVRVCQRKGRPFWMLDNGKKLVPIETRRWYYQERRALK